MYPRCTQRIDAIVMVRKQYEENQEGNKTLYYRLKKIYNRVPREVKRRRVPHRLAGVVTVLKDIGLGEGQEQSAQRILEKDGVGYIRDPHVRI